MKTQTADELVRENEELRRRLEEAEDAIRALRAGEADAVLVENGREQVYTLETADKPYRLLVAQVPHAAATLTADGSVIACNRRFADLLGWPPTSLADRPLRDFVVPDSRASLDALIRDGRTIEVQDAVTLLRGDGMPVTIWLGVNALREGALGLCLMATDLTERRHYEELQRTQEALRDSEAQLAAELADAKLLQEISTRLIREDDVDALYRQILDAAADLMRSDFATMQALDVATGSLRLLAHRGFDDAFAESVREVSTGASTTCGIAFRGGRRVVAPDLTTFEGIAGTPSCDAHLAAGVRAAQSTPLVSRSGAVLGMISTHWRAPHEPSERDLRLLDLLARQAADLVERKRAEQALQASEARLRSILDNMPAAVYLVDDRQRFIFINRRWKADFDLTNEQAAGRPVAEFFPPDVAEQFAANNRRVLESGRPVEAEEIVPFPDGEHTYISSKVPLFDAAGTPHAVCGISIDITERKRAVQALKDADRKKDEFLATLAHELRNPLAPIRNAVEILLTKGPPDPQLVRARQLIDRQVQVMARLLEDLLDVSRISRNKMELRRRRVELGVVVEAALEISRPLIEAGGHQLTVTLPPESVRLDADPVRLAQVFANLLNNAAKYTEQAGRIELSVARDGGHVVVSVKDSGIGIAAEMLPRVFDIFTQAQPALERSQGGLGIGLSLVKGLVDLHCGTIEAKSGGPGKGSEFVVRLPVAAETPSQGPAPPAEDDGQLPSVIERRVLIVDDNRDSADSLAELLNIMGHQVGTAYDGEQAVEAAGALRPEVVLLDIGMPKLNGYDACRRIREQPWGRGMFLIALTGWGQEEDRRRTEEAGFNQHMVKPVDPALLTKLLASLSSAGS